MYVGRFMMMNHTTFIRKKKEFLQRKNKNVFTLFMHIIHFSLVLDIFLIIVVLVH